MPLLPLIPIHTREDQLMLYRREFWYRDNNGKQQMVVVESNDGADFTRISAIYGRLALESIAEEKAWKNGHTTFADLAEEVSPDQFHKSVASKEHSNGFPWDSNDTRFSFAIALGEGMQWSGPESLWVEPVETGKRVCRCCGGVQPLPLVACCLNCDRTGRDAAIPRVTPYDLARRVEPKPAPTKLPETKRDRAGRELVGGMGKRRAG